MKKIIFAILVMMILATVVIAAPKVIEDTESFEDKVADAMKSKSKIEDKADEEGCGDGTCKSEYNFLFKNYCSGISDPYSKANNKNQLWGGANNQFNQAMPQLGQNFQYQQMNPLGNSNSRPLYTQGSSYSGGMYNPIPVTQANSGAGPSNFNGMTPRLGRATLLLSLVGQTNAINPRSSANNPVSYPGAPGQATYANGYSQTYSNQNYAANSGGRYNQFSTGGSPFGTTGMGYNQGGEGPIDSTQTAMQAMLCGNVEALYGHNMVWLQRMKQVEQCYEYMLQQPKVTQESLLQCKVMEAQVHCSMSQMLFAGQGYGMSSNNANNFGGNTFGNIGQVYNVWSDKSLMGASSQYFNQGSSLADNCIDSYIRDIEIIDVAATRPTDVQSQELDESPTIRNFEIIKEDLNDKELFTVTGEIDAGSSNVSYTVFLKCRSSSRTIGSGIIESKDSGPIELIESTQDKIRGCNSGAVKFSYELDSVKREKIKVINFE